MSLKRLLSLAVAAAAAVFGAAAQGADVEVVVTASRIEEPAADVPASVSVITAADLNASGEPTLVDALDRLAGVSFRSTTGGPAQAEVSMRGFGDGSVTRVLVLVDGRRVNRPDLAGTNWLQVPVENVERVEVVRGPASVLYGDHAVGGVINIITKKGGDKFSVTASGMGGSFALNQERLGVSGPAGGAHFSFNGERSSSDGYRDRSAWSSLGGGASLDGSIGGVDGSLRLGYDQTEYQLPGFLTKAQWKDDPTQAQPGHTGDEARDRTLDVDLGLSAKVGDSLKLQGNVTYAWNGVESDFPVSFFFPNITIQTLAATPRAVLSTALDGRSLKVIAGSDLYWDGLRRVSYSDEGRSAKTADADVSRLSVGAYATASHALADPLTVEIGGRTELTRIAADARLGSTLDDSKTINGWAASASLLYQPVESMRAYLRLDRTYRYPALDEQVSYYGFGMDQFLDIRPEVGYGADVGVDLSAAGGVRFAANVYLLAMTDEIVFNGATFLNENLDTRHLGAEAQASWTIGPLDLSGTYAWHLTTLASGPNKDNQLPLVPNHTLGAEARVRLPFGLTAAATGRCVTESYQGNDYANAQDRVSAYGLFGASMSWIPRFVPGRLEVFAGVENLLDSNYAPLIYYSAFSGQSAYYPAPGRSWRVGGFYRY